jgi:glycosyltransferase involved in cell wall biosynthesis
MPKLSILMPAYNQARFIGQAIESLRAQSFSDWELVVVDDGSTDGTGEVIQAIRDQHIQYLYQPNQGCPSALNNAFSHSRGAQILILASDDWLLPHSLETLDRALQQNPGVDVVHSDGYVADGEGNLLEPLSNYRQAPFGDTLDSWVVASPVVGVHSAMIRRGPLERLQGPFDEQMLGYEDWDLFIRLKALGCRFLYVPEFTCCYRFHGDNKSAPKSSLSGERRQSLIRNRIKVLGAPWFDALSLPARYQFLLGFLTGPLEGDLAAQEGVLAHPSFRRLPARERSQLLYRLSVKNSLGMAAWGQEFRHLAEAVRLHPQDPRPYLLLILTAFEPHLRRGLLRLWRRVRSGPEGADAVTQILRARSMA